MLIKKPSGIKSSEITDRGIYMNRREFIKTGGTLLGALALWVANPRPFAFSDEPDLEKKLKDIRPSPLSTSEEQTPYRQATTYNNFYEFALDKESPARLARNFKTHPWRVSIEGEVRKPAAYHLEDLVKPHALEERVYRLRCVEGWSMVIPWVGVPLGEIVKRFEPTSKAKFVEFTTLFDPEQMPGQRREVLEWPYVEGLRMDEAMHPLSILAVGMYGEILPNQNGAPLRLVVPWKYGFKSSKSIVRIRFLEKPSSTTWAKANPGEYGFYANVNPEVDHPRWSQATERRIGEFSRRKTLMFNGYAEQVGSMYAGMNLRKNF